MTVFAKRAAMDVNDWAKIQDQVRDLLMSSGGLNEIMMFSIDVGAKQDIYLGMPNEGLLRLFPGFVAIAREALPDYLVTLVANNTGFAEKFPDIAAKRRSPYD